MSDLRDQVQVSRMMSVPFRVARDVSGGREKSAPHRVAHILHSSSVTAGALVSAPTPLSMARIYLSCIRAIAVTHY